MSDPIKDLEDFGSEGTPMTPLAPSEVRRRGDRMRRRRTVLATVGSVAAVAVIAGGGLLMVGGTDQAEGPGPATDPSATTAPPADPLTRIPTDFPLDAGVEGAQVTDSNGMSDLALCGATPLADVATIDRRTATLSGGEASIERTVLLFEGPDEAAAVHRAVVESAAECTSDQDGTVAVRPTDRSWPGNTITVDYGTDSTSTEPNAVMTHLVTQGNALLLTRQFGHWSGELEKGVTETRSQVSKTVEAMDVFGEPAGPVEIDGGQ